MAVLGCRSLVLVIIIPQSCDGRGCNFSTENALGCRFGGLVVHRHIKVWDAIGDLALLVLGNVIMWACGMWAIFFYRWHSGSWFVCLRSVYSSGWGIIWSYMSDY